MTKIITLEVPLKLGNHTVASIEVHPLTFMSMVKVWDQAGRVKGVKGEVALQRQRMVFQGHFLDAAGKRLPVLISDLNQIPIKTARELIESLDLDQGTLGEVIMKGDGATSPIVYKLGTPIEMNSKADGGVSITELQFLASTYGEVEEVLACDSQTDRAAALIEKVADPVGVDGLMRLPGWAMDKLTVADGVGIMRHVLPSF